MKTVFKVNSNTSDFLNEYKKYGKNSFLCPEGFNSISEFVKRCKECPGKNMIVTFSFDEPMWFNLGDTILLNNIYYKVFSKAFYANQNIIRYYLNFE